MTPSTALCMEFLLTPLREGRLNCGGIPITPVRFLLTPLREGRLFMALGLGNEWKDFYSRPCGRGDEPGWVAEQRKKISTHAPAGGATRVLPRKGVMMKDFYSRPCGRGDVSASGRNL